MLAVVLRVGLFPFAENKHGDAPMRALVAERMVLDPASAAVPRTYCQFGPLHTTLMRPFIALDPYAPRSSRYLSLLCGLAVFFPFLAFARRLVGEARAPLAAFALAVSPLHLQASTTASSEALYLLLWVAAIERLLAALESKNLGTFAVAGLLASLAAVTRYDAWLALPMVAVAAWWFFARLPNPASVTRGLAVFALAASIFPVAWLAWGAAAGGDPLFFAHYISSDHAGLGATAAARYGAWLGRARQLGVWSLAFVAAMTPAGAVLAAVALKRGARALSPAMRVAVVAALGPPAIYLAEGLIAQGFEPLARFALVPGALLLPLAVSAVPLERVRAFLSRPRSCRRPRFPLPSGWSPPSGGSASGPAPNRWGRSPGWTARIARWPPTCAPSADPGSASCSSRFRSPRSASPTRPEFPGPNRSR